MGEPEWILQSPHGTDDKPEAARTCPKQGRSSTCGSRTYEYSHEHRDSRSVARRQVRTAWRRFAGRRMAASDDCLLRHAEGDPNGYRQANRRDDRGAGEDRRRAQDRRGPIPGRQVQRCGRVAHPRDLPRAGEPSRPRDQAHQGARTVSGPAATPSHSPTGHRGDPR